MYLPAFYHVAEFAEMFGFSESHIRSGCNNYINGHLNSGRSRLPLNFGCFKWGGIYVVYHQRDAATVAKLFGVELSDTHD